MDGFQIKCLNCGSINVSIIEEGDYVLNDDYYESWEIQGYKFKCRDCGAERECEGDE